MAGVILEICVDDVVALNNAVAGGADRIELCSALNIGGLTPSAGLIKSAARIPVPVCAMIRPRAGNFVYSSAEIDLMRHDIDVVLEAGLAGIVLGVLKINNHLDTGTMHTLLQHASGLETTLHRAVDLVPNIGDAIEIAVSLGF
ncbi:MAG: copper homeostasis protein CutC, partial [Hyphomicrobiales bacterium]|nr:copper homeostasis protein CutC [Hyphomicrobiales bacterium]